MTRIGKETQNQIFYVGSKFLGRNIFVVTNKNAPSTEKLLFFDNCSLTFDMFGAYGTLKEYEMSFYQKAMRCVPTSRSLLLGVAVMSLTACQTIGGLKPEPTVVDVQAEVPVKPDWVEPAPDELPSTDWVGDFGSDELLNVVNVALERNTTIGQRVAQLDQALSRIQTSRAGLLPSLNFSGSASRSAGGTNAIGQSNPGFESYSLSLGASWEADLFGRVRDQVNSAELGAAASSADVAATRLSIAGQVSQGWFNIIQADLLVDLSNRDIETQERALRLTQRRFENGIAGASDVRLARSSVANAEALLALRLQNRDALIRSLKTLLRDYPDAEMEIPSDLPLLPVLEGVSTPSYVLQRRPDVLAAERRIAAAGLDVDAARKALYPSLTFTGSLGENTATVSDLFDLTDFASRIAANIAAPIFDGGRIRSQIDGQEAVLRQQVETYVGTVLSAFQEVENALDAEGRLAERESALRVSLNEAQEAENRLEERYVEGLATILQLLDAQSRRISAEGQLINARTERLNNRVRMHVALGGGQYGSEIPVTQPERTGILGLLDR